MHKSWRKRPLVAAVMLASSMVLPSTLAAADDTTGDATLAKSDETPTDDATVVPQPAAASPPPPSPGVQSRMGLEEVIVTATRRATSVYEVPYNISAFSGGALEELGVTDLGDLAQVVSGLGYIDPGPRAAGNNNGFIMRGLNSTSASAFDVSNATAPTVSTYLGETPVFFNFKLTDLERVEVLRGPQGTLYGSGSLGGTIRFIPNEPNPEEFAAHMKVGGSWTDHSDENSYNFEGMINIPLGDTAALRLSGGYEKLGGFINDNGLVVRDTAGVPVIDGPILDPQTDLVRRSKNDVDSADVSNFRAALAVELADNIGLELGYNYQENTADGRQANNSQFPGNAKYEESLSNLEPFKSRVHLVSADIVIDFGFASLTSSSSYYDINVDSEADSSGFYQTNLAQYYFSYPRFSNVGEFTNDEDVFVEEIRLVSNEGDKFNWVLGAYYQKQNKTYKNTDLPDAGLGVWLLALDPYPGAYGIPTPDLSNVNLFENKLDTSFEDIALFGELTWNLTESWQITGGARFFWQDYSANIETAVPACYALFEPLGVGDACGAPPNGVARVNAATTDKDDILKFNTSYDISPDNLVYFTWAQGFRHGGVNGLPISGFFAAPVSELSYASDTADNFELGIKGRLLDGALGYTVAGFYIDWQDIQFDGFTDVGFNAVFNGGSASSRGLESEFVYTVTDSLSATFGYTYTDAYLDEDFSEGGTQGFKGDQLVGVPKHTANIALNYQKSLDGGQTLFLGMNGSYRSEANALFNSTNRNFFVMDAFGVLNLSAGLETEFGTFQLYADNVFSEEGTTGGNVNTDSRGEYFQVIRPLTIGFTYTRTFGAED